MTELLVKRRGRLVRRGVADDDLGVADFPEGAARKAISA
jgi:hypothetical protein